MKLNEIFTDRETLIYKVTNFYQTDKMSDWIVERTPLQLIPEWDGEEETWLVVKGYIISGGEKTEECFIDISIPERTSEFVFRLQNNELKIQHIYEENLQTIPAMASEQYGDPDLYFIKENPQIGVEILKAGKKISTNPSAIIDDLAYIYEELRAKQEE
jgi:hypothetical protein